ncbi:uncharacterized protein LOC110722962 [Chenopodium quinoa]|uniref:uncharacterized protein LOC110722962 n=1 Tax=Chenopodium quinoa TaxID=63459 RepID=UPI000B77AA22|nr:uncharacterized protein LOC110722962 [Chenopodium quinoa]
MSNAVVTVSSSMNPLILSLVENGKTLSSQLKKAKNQTKIEDNSSTITRQERLKIIHEDVQKVVHQALEKIESHQLPSSFPETIIPKLYQKIQTILHNFIKHDTNNASKYEELAKIVNDKKQSLAVGASPQPGVQPHHSASLARSSTQLEASSTSNDQLEDGFASLGDTEKSCLICFYLFSAGKEIKKREPIHLWIGMNLVQNQSEGAQKLAKLVANGFIERTIGNKMLCNRYKMNGNVRYMVAPKVNIKEEGPWLIMDHQPQQQQQQQQHQQSQNSQPASNNPVPAVVQQKSFLNRISTFNQKGQDDKDVTGTLVLNIRENFLGGTTFKRLSDKKSTVKVLHLGSWDHNHKRYIMVEDIEALKALIKQMGQVTYLSLEGISGIVKLPDSVYKLEYLKVLDLRACPNLESLSEGIDSLKQLTHLDLSECYLLAYIPKGITSLTELRVLKGFVINPEDTQGRGNNGKAKGKNASPTALFSDLLKLKKLVKLTIRTRRINFPTTDDFVTLSSMELLENLRVAWVWSSADGPSDSASATFPPSLKKLELQAAPEDTMSRLLRLISEDTKSSLEKLYIRGGRFWDLGMEMHCFQHVHTVRLRYLPELRINWDEFIDIFPKTNPSGSFGMPQSHLLPMR